MSKNTLQALLPIHALRERRALRLYHEQQQAHAQAVQAEAETRGEQQRLDLAAAITRASIGAAGDASPADMQWQLQMADDLKAQAQVKAEALPQLSEQVQRLHGEMDEARAAHLARVRGHRKVELASEHWAKKANRVLAQRAEQQADDDFAVRWAVAQAGEKDSA